MGFPGLLVTGLVFEELNEAFEHLACAAPLSLVVTYLANSRYGRTHRVY